MSISEYVFVLLLSFCRTTIQKVRPLGMSTRFVVFGLRSCLGWFGMFGMFGFFTSLSFPKPRFVVFWSSFLFGLVWYVWFFHFFIVS